jgi:hypothetical protein
MAALEIHEFPDGGLPQDNDKAIAQRGTGGGSGFHLNMKNMRSYFNLLLYNPSREYLTGEAAVFDEVLLIANKPTTGTFEPADWDVVKFPFLTRLELIQSDPGDIAAPAQAGNFALFVDLNGNLALKDSNDVVTQVGSNVQNEGEWKYYVTTANIGQSLDSEGNVRVGFESGVIVKQLRSGGQWVTVGED